MAAANGKSPRWIVDNPHPVYAGNRQTELGDHSDGYVAPLGVMTAETYGDLLHMAEHLRLMGRAYRDSSPEAAGILHDGLRRPFTYSTIFRHFPSFRRSLEFIYADPLDVDDCPVIDYARRFWLGHDRASGGGISDVRKNAEVDLATERLYVAWKNAHEGGDDAAIVEYRGLIETTYGVSV